MNEKRVEHRINLSASWNLLKDSDVQRRINLNELLQTNLASMSLRRFFNRPTNLNDKSQIFLELVQLPAGMECVFNGELLGICDSSQCRFEITDSIRSGQNVIQINNGSLTTVAGDLQPRVNLVII